MPIANCIVKKKYSSNILKLIPKELATDLNIDIKDITINFIESFFQAGNPYEIMIFLKLPSIWEDKDIKRIEKGFVSIFSKIINISVQDIFLITEIIQSGHVVDNGEIEYW